MHLPRKGLACRRAVIASLSRGGRLWFGSDERLPHRGWGSRFPHRQSVLHYPPRNAYPTTTRCPGRVKLTVPRHVHRLVDTPGWPSTLIFFAPGVSMMAMVSPICWDNTTPWLYATIPPEIPAEYWLLPWLALALAFILAMLLR